MIIKPECDIIYFIIWQIMLSRFKAKYMLTLLPVSSSNPFTGDDTMYLRSLNTEYRLPIVMFIILFILFAAGLLCDIAHYFYKKKHCTERVEAIVHEVIVRDGSENSMLSDAIYAYYHKGKEYLIKERFYRTASSLKAGDHIPLYIDPEDPEDVFDRYRELRIHTYICVILATFMIGLVVGFLPMLIAVI